MSEAAVQSSEKTVAKGIVNSDVNCFKANASNFCNVLSTSKVG